MKAKVMQIYIDKYSKKEYKKGEVIEISQERFEEMNSTSFGIIVEEIAEEIKEEIVEGESGARST